jgi:hypothetical protein
VLASVVLLRIAAFLMAYEDVVMKKAGLKPGLYNFHRPALRNRTGVS